MSQSFSTDRVPISDRLEAWQRNARQICGDCRFQFPKRHPFHGSVEKRTLAGVQLTRFASSPVSFAKFPIVTATSEDRDCIVITQLEGVRRYFQDGTVSTLRPGDSTLVDSGRPWSSECTGDCARLYLRFPGWLVHDRLRMASLPLLPRISGISGIGATLFRLATSLYEEAEMLTSEQGSAAIEAYLDLLAGCIGRPQAALPKPGHQAELCSRIESFIESHLAEPTLDPAEIASAAGVSVRHLHRLFVTKGCTVAEWIRERRLERCRTDLSDPRFCDKNITEIAFHWGFSDSAHFSRCFKKEFGICPRVFRSGAWSGRWNGERAEQGRSFLALGKTNANRPT
jgi:AraC family transcriptional regulator, positive regulator of tynA and feaB